jgi:hypothetical protein
MRKKISREEENITQKRKYHAKNKKMLIPRSRKHSEHRFFDRVKAIEQRRGEIQRKVTAKLISKNFAEGPSKIFSKESHPADISSEGIIKYLFQFEQECVLEGESSKDW